MPAGQASCGGGASISAAGAEAVQAHTPGCLQGRGLLLGAQGPCLAGQALHLIPEPLPLLLRFARLLCLHRSPLQLSSWSSGEVEAPASG